MDDKAKNIHSLALHRKSLSTPDVEIKDDLLKVEYVLGNKY